MRKEKVGFQSSENAELKPGLSIPRQSYRIAEFCSAFRISRNSFYEQVHRGNLKVIRVGRRVLVTIEAANAWIRKLEKAGGK